MSLCQSLSFCHNQNKCVIVFFSLQFYIKQPESLKRYIIHMHWRSQNIFLLHSPLYFMGSCTQYTVEKVRKQYSGYVTAYMQNTRKLNWVYDERQYFTVEQAIFFTNNKRTIQRCVYIRGQLTLSFIIHLLATIASQHIRYWQCLVAKV